MVDLLGSQAAGPGSDYEAQRAARIAENKKRMEELGIHTSVAALTESLQVPKPASQPRQRKQRAAREERGPRRRSGRLQGTEPETLAEDELFRKMGISSLDLLPVRRRRHHVDSAALTALLEQRQAEGVGRSGLDSGLGVRLQGGRIYDSKLGVTCHWCRQKTLEEKVECTADGCGGGSRLPTAFCSMCLRNRHGEDVTQAIASGCWVCPACRGSCGPGCTTCCNCGPCRKKAGLGPTHQLIKLARAAGFENVHDYLVHTETGESAEEIAARKANFPWMQGLVVAEEEDSQQTVARTPSAAETLATGDSESEELQQTGNVEPNLAVDGMEKPPASKKMGSSSGGGVKSGRQLKTAGKSFVPGSKKKVVTPRRLRSTAVH